MGDVIGYGLEYKELIYGTIKACPQHTFLFLTKNPEKLPAWSPFPDNCWVGITVTNPEMYREARKILPQILASLIYLSIEPFLEYIPMSAMGLNKANISWLIIGAQTKPYKPPKIEWVQEIVEAADKAGCPVFLKDNLSPLLCENCTYTKDKWALSKDKLFKGELWRQEMPK